MTEPSTAIERAESATAAGTSPDGLTFGQMLSRAKVLAGSGLVPKSLQGNPEGIVLVGALGAELGVSFVTSLSEVHVIEGRPSPSSQLRLALIRRAGHEAMFVESSGEKAVIRGRRREHAGDLKGWVTVTWTIEQARQAGLLDLTYERWVATADGGKRRPVRWVEGSTEERPDWLGKADVEVKRRENWWRYPAEMLRARAASALCRMHFSDVLLGLGPEVDLYTAEEHGVDVGQEVDEPAEDGLAFDIVDAELVDDKIVGEPVSPVPSGARAERAEPVTIPGSAAASAPPPEQRPLDNADAAHNASVDPGPSPAVPDPGVAVAPPGSGATWKERCRGAGVSQACLLRQAAEYARERDIAPPTRLDEITDQALMSMLADWLSMGSPRS